MGVVVVRKRYWRSNDTYEPRAQGGREKSGIKREKHVRDDVFSDWAGCQLVADQRGIDWNWNRLLAAE